jgi:NarL family two-component system response regulator LiaR
MPSPARSKNRITVLLCDDHAMVREGTRRLLEAEPDMEVVGEASDGIEAVEMAMKLSPQVVAMDVSMPRMNGVEATKRVKEANPSTYVLALTAYDDFQYVTRLLENGASGYILKSARSDELIAAIRATALGESILDQKVAKEVFSRIARRSPQERAEGVDPSQPQGTEPGAEASAMSSESAKATKEASRSTSIRDNNPCALTAKERSVLVLAARGLSNKEIAQAQKVSPRTIQSHLASVFVKLGVASRTEAVITALKKGIISEKDIEVTSGE